LNNNKKFVPIDGNNKTNTKSYRLTKKRFSKGLINVNQNPLSQNVEMNESKE
jgi:hypothetical protein